MTKHESTIAEHVASNVKTCIDQVDNYASEKLAVDAYYQNTIDSVLDDGYNRNEAGDAGLWFIVEYRRLTGYKG